MFEVHDFSDAHDSKNPCNEIGSGVPKWTSAKKCDNPLRGRSNEGGGRTEAPQTALGKSLAVTHPTTPPRLLHAPHPHTPVHHTRCLLVSSPTTASPLLPTSSPPPLPTSSHPHLLLTVTAQRVCLCECDESWSGREDCDRNSPWQREHFAIVHKKDLRNGWCRWRVQKGSQTSL